MSADFHQARPQQRNSDGNPDQRISITGSDLEEEKVQEGEDVVDMQLTIDVDSTNGEVAIERQSNTFASKKTAAQGMMDIALITANANQLRYIVEFLNKSWNYYIILTLVIVSLTLQVTVGVALIFKGKLALSGKSKKQLLNNFITVGVFLITIINIFIASLTDTGSAYRDN